MKESDVIQITCMFFDIINNMPDSEETASVVILFFKLIHKENSYNEVIPNIEMMTVLRKEKPTVYEIMRKHGKNNLFIGILVELEMNYGEAKRRLEFLK